MRSAEMHQVKPPSAQCREDQRAGHRQPCIQVTIQAKDIEMVTSYMYLGVHLNNKLDLTDHTAAIYKQVRADSIC